MSVTCGLMPITTPSCAPEALVQGWHMVCVLPVNLYPSDLLEQILEQFEAVAFFPYTHTNGFPHGEQNRPVWVKGFNGTTEGKRVLLAAFFEGNNTALFRFIREVMAECVPGLRLSRDSAKKKHTAPSQLLKRRFLESTVT